MLFLSIIFPNSFFIQPLFFSIGIVNAVFSAFIKIVIYGVSHYGLWRVMKALWNCFINKNGIMNKREISNEFSSMLL